MTQSKKVLITDKVHPLLPEKLKAMGFEVDYHTSVENSRLEEIIDQYAGIVINSKIKMHAAMIDRAIHLKFIGRLGSGLEIIDVDYATQKKIHVFNSPEGNRNAVAEHEVGMILALMNHLLRADRQVRAMFWDRELNRGRELKGKTLGIIGLGHTGTAFAQKLSSWGLTILSYDKYRMHYPANLRFVQKGSLEYLKKNADIISLHLPLTDETRYLINQDFFNGCKDGFILSNTSRGEIVDTTALIEALKSGKIGGACLDVFENEKPDSFTEEEEKKYRALYDMEQVVLSPHIAGWTKESLEKIAEVLFEKIQKFINEKM